ncbi:MAG: Flp family type IVb pilin [Chloroflexi bacterium]|nr:Flp family type IVb pilin [Chloroflexota bacterium]MDA0244205.1 Flp family type IVb pilin [Chloroflexota bacterium]
MLYLPAESGQGLVEYGLILVLIAVTVAVILGTVGETIYGVFSEVGSDLASTRD